MSDDISEPTDQQPEAPQNAEKGTPTDPIDLAIERLNEAKTESEADAALALAAWAIGQAFRENEELNEVAGDRPQGLFARDRVGQALSGIARRAASVAGLDLVRTDAAKVSSAARAMAIRLGAKEFSFGVNLGATPGVSITVTWDLPAKKSVPNST